MTTNSFDSFISQVEDAYYVDWDHSRLRMRNRSCTIRLSREELNNINTCLPLTLDEYSRRATSLRVALLKQLAFMKNPRIQVEKGLTNSHQTYWIQDIDSIESIDFIDDPANPGRRSLRISGNMTSTSFYVNFHLRDTCGYVSKTVTDQWLNVNFPGAADKARNLEALGVTNARECWSLIKQSIATPSNSHPIHIDGVSFD